MASSHADEIHSIINPYELFGVDPQTVTLKALKRKYYELALLVHPDKNHGLDGHDMHVVHSAYKYCEREILHTASKADGTSVESLTEAFAEFCRLQQEAPPPFRDIMEDALDMQRFHREFEADQHAFRASFVGGYGDVLEPSSTTTSCVGADDNPQQMKMQGLDDGDHQRELKHDFSKSLTVYNDPVMSAPRGDFYDYARQEPVTNYSVHLKRMMCLTDYKEAHCGPMSHLEDDHDKSIIDRDVHSAFEHRKRENEAFDRACAAAAEQRRPMVQLRYAQQ